jgi:hypothetical protein
MAAIPWRARHRLLAKIRAEWGQPIGRSDDLQAGKSYYMAEVEAVLSLVHASGSTEPHLFLFDELFRGTNAVERIAGSRAPRDAGA